MFLESGFSMALCAPSPQPREPPGGRRSHCRGWVPFGTGIASAFSTCEQTLKACQCSVPFLWTFKRSACPSVASQSEAHLTLSKLSPPTCDACFRRAFPGPLRHKAWRMWSTVFEGSVVRIEVPPGETLQQKRAVKLDRKKIFSHLLSGKKPWKVFDSHKATLKGGCFLFMAMGFQ